MQADRGVNVVSAPLPVSESARLGPGRRMLDMFTGTGSVGEVFAEEGYEVVSLDINPRFKPTIVADILAWDYKKTFPPGYFEVVFACPPALSSVRRAQLCLGIQRRVRSW